MDPALESRFADYAETIRQLPAHIAADAPLPAELEMTRDHRYQVYYAPFDHVTLSARVVLVGITPGKQQANAAYVAAGIALRAGQGHQDALATAKATASFAGPLRRNLVDLLDHVGVAAKLGIPSAGELWTAKQELVHFTSALRYPVLEQHKNYAGGGISGSALLAREIDRWFAAECRALSSALFVPLGPAALWACERQVAAGALQGTQILRGLPHPSGANAERVAYFLRRKAPHLLSSKTRPEPLDAGRDLALRSVEAWNA